MNISSASSLSGMQAASLRVDNVANNVANVNTQDFRPQRIEQTETASARAGRDSYEPGTAARVDRASGNGTEAYAAGRQEPDLARDMTDLTTQRNAYSANAAAAGVQNETARTTIDLVA
jgi:flagellar hook protein FlgE